VSRATCVVRFPDGELRVAVFDGTYDVAGPELCTVGQWERYWRDGDGSWPRSWRDLDDWPAHEPDPENCVLVTLATNYGDGITWYGEATKERILRNSVDPFGADTDENGLPLWWPWPPNDGNDWVTDYRAVDAGTPIF
jgi:hypothetical protein